MTINEEIASIGTTGAKHRLWQEIHKKVQESISILKNIQEGNFLQKANDAEKKLKIAKTMFHQMTDLVIAPEPEQEPDPEAIP